ncbi:GCD complex subunit gcd7 [Coniosporium tulheliwenetii]|uniref:GCD complex subunit gcd7 n=1 Tax=Coniosporium tulheliwenetii TaxID=3383036 RepID=A0ACC2Z3W9_9PEZI|nr:GCD complex subunit gcd7 [Cladosporium sp. JES 115]
MAANITPGLTPFLKSLKATPVESSIEHFISLLKRRQIRNSRPCAIATTQLLLRVVAEFKGRDVNKLLQRIRHVGQRLTAAQPREMAVGNIHERRRLQLALPANDGPHHDSLKRPALSSSISTFSPLRHGATLPAEPAGLHHSESSAGTESTEPHHRPNLFTSHTSYAPMHGSLLNIFQHGEFPGSSASTPPGYQSPTGKATPLMSQSFVSLGDAGPKKEKDLKAEVVEGIRELLDELDQVDDQIAAYALDHIHSNEIILTHTASTTVQKFLLTAARKRKFTVVHAEAYPNDSADTHATVLDGRKTAGEGDADADERFKPLTAAGITVILIPDSAVFAIMSRVNKVILATHTVLANGGLVAAAGARTIAKAAKMHQTPVVVVSGVYKLSPVYPFDVEELIEYGDAGKVADYDDGDFVDKVDVVNPLYDYVPADLVDLYITNLGVMRRVICIALWQIIIGWRISISE